MTLFLNLYSCWILFIGYQVPKSIVKTTTAIYKAESRTTLIAEGGLLRNLFHKLQQDLLCGDRVRTIQQTPIRKFRLKVKGSIIFFWKICSETIDYTSISVVRFFRSQRNGGNFLTIC